MAHSKGHVLSAHLLSMEEETPEQQRESVLMMNPEQQHEPQVLRQRAFDWAFVWSEIKCYGKYILPIVLVNVVIIAILLVSV